MKILRRDPGTGIQCGINHLGKLFWATCFVGITWRTRRRTGKSCWRIWPIP